MIYGFAGKILHVNLTDSTTWIEEPPATFYRRYLGGNGFVAYYLLKEVPRGADPLGPENVLIFAGGATTAVPVAGGGRSSMGGKSPLTGGYGEAEAGGYFGAELQLAGFDALIVHGQASQPVYLWVHQGEVEIRSAAHLWGLQSLECQTAIRDELNQPRAKVALIGPAGERRVRVAAVIHDANRAAGRTGLGAVMGSKNLKAVAALGSARVPLADPEGLKELALWMRNNWKQKSAGLHDTGTPGSIPDLNELGAFPTRNFQDGRFEDFASISGQTMRDTILVERGSCYACAIACKRVVEVETDDFKARKEYGGPEYETVSANGSNCGVSDLAAISMANELCNAYGLDTISTAVMISFAMECFENGLLTLEDTGGLELRFGNAQALVEMTRQIGERVGLGALLGEGPKIAAATIGQGAERYAIHVKGQPLPMHECRVRHGQGLGYAVSPTGADHMHNFWDSAMRNDPVGEEMQAWGVYEPLPMNQLNPSKVRAYMHASNWAWLDNHLGLCMFVPWSVDQTVSLVRAITGWKTHTHELQLAARRGVTLARIFNLREGFTRADDVLPARMSEPFVSGSIHERPIDPAVLDEHIGIFYGMMGWDPGTGTPLRATLQQLDIEWAVDHLLPETILAGAETR
jgi:aldehyde:ferredoxin oxidoreductase